MLLLTNQLFESSTELLLLPSELQTLSLFELRTSSTLLLLLIVQELEMSLSELWASSFVLVMEGPLTHRRHPLELTASLSEPCTPVS
jgi:hypothetical protein